jgi:hypothetical protein
VQLVRPGSQAALQAPNEHTVPAEHLRPHVPQLLKASTQAPLQRKQS